MEIHAPPGEPVRSDAGGDFLPLWAEEVEAMRSTHGCEEALLTMCRNYGVREEEFRPFCAGEGCAPCTPLPAGSNAVCVFEGMLEAGVRFPLRDCYAELLSHYSLAPSQVTPNAWRFLTGFALLCEGAGVQPTAAVFRHFFKLRPHGGKLQGWYYFLPYSESRRLFKSHYLPCNDEWKTRFFFLESRSPWRCPMKWGTPTTEAWDTEPVLTDTLRTDIGKLEAEKFKDISLMELLCNSQYQAPAVTTEPTAGAPASAPLPKRKYNTLSSVSDPQLLTVPVPSSPLDFTPADCGELSTSKILMNACQLVQITQAELYRLKDELQAEKSKRADDAVRFENELAAAKAEHMVEITRITEELRNEVAAAKAIHTADLAKLKKELDAAKAQAQHISMGRPEDIQAAEAEHNKAIALADAQQAKASQIAGQLQSCKAQLEVFRAAQVQHTIVVDKLREELRAERDERVRQFTREQVQYRGKLRAVEAEHADKVRQLMEDLQAAEAKVRKLTELRAAEAERVAKVRELVLTLYPDSPPH